MTTLTRIFSCLGCSALLLGTLAFAQTSTFPAPVQGANLSLEVLSDTGGANMNPYFEHLTKDLRQHWMPLLTAAEQEHPVKQAETVIDLTILPDGDLAAMRLASSTQNDALNKAAWSALAQQALPTPPAGLKASQLKLRIHFLVNE